MLRNFLNMVGIHYEFAHEWILWFVLLIIPMIVWYIFKHKSNVARIKVSSTADYYKHSNSFMQYLMHIPLVLRCIAIVALIIALARPYSVNHFSDSTSFGVDIVLAMDVSSSMLAMDLKPDRIEASKDVAAKFINTRPFDRIGLVVFSGETFTQCPITTDHAQLLNLLDELKCGMIEDGTAIGMGLSLGVTRLKESKAKSKVVILLTDGMNNQGDIDPLTAAELAKKYGVRVYTIGVGTRGKAPYPATDFFGRKTVQYGDVEIDEDILRNISNKTDGQYFRATNKSELVSIYEKIDALEKTKIENSKFTKKQEEFFWFAFWGLVALVTELLVRLTVFKRFP